MGRLTLFAVSLLMADIKEKFRFNILSVIFWSLIKLYQY